LKKNPSSWLWLPKVFSLCYELLKLAGDEAIGLNQCWIQMIFISIVLSKCIILKESLGKYQMIYFLRTKEIYPKRFRNRHEKAPCEPMISWKKICQPFFARSSATIAVMEFVTLPE
jgi:hypothetical protein